VNFYLCFYLPNRCACVSLSSGFPGGLRFSSNLALWLYAVDTCSDVVRPFTGEQAKGLIRSEHSFCVTIEPRFTPGLLWSDEPNEKKIGFPEPVPFWFKPLNPRWLVHPDGASNARLLSLFVVTSWMGFSSRFGVTTF